jgi:hypothetical protein
MRIALAMPMVGDPVAEGEGPRLSLAVEAARFGEVAVCTVQDYLPHFRARNQLIEQALVSECDVMFWIDADSILPPLAFARLFQTLQKTKAQAVAGFCYRRGYPFTSSWTKAVAGKTFYLDASPTGEPCVIDSCGFPCTILDLKWVKENLKPPFFAQRLGSDGKIIEWEDGFFFRKLKEAGGKLLGDPTVRCGHAYLRTIIMDKNVDYLRKDALAHGAN